MQGRFATKLASNDDCGRLDDCYVEFGETDPILGEKLNQNVTNPLGFPAIFLFPILVLQHVDAILHAFALPELPLLYEILYVCQLPRSAANW